MLDRHRPQLPQRSLQSLAQRLETLRVSDLHRFPVRVRQHKMINEMLKPLAQDRDRQRVHLAEVRLTLLPGPVNLREKHLLLRPMHRSPQPHPPLQRPQLPIPKPLRISSADLLKNGLALKTAVSLQKLFDLPPYIPKRVRPSTPIVSLAKLLG